MYREAPPGGAYREAPPGGTYREAPTGYELLCEITDLSQQTVSQSVDFVPAKL